MDLKPLSWPDSVRRPKGLQKFLKGFPIIGPERSAWRAFRREVADRPEDCLALWKQDEQTLRTRDALINILCVSLGWKGWKFIPADPCDVLFFNPRDRDGMDLLDAKYRMERQFGIKMDKERVLQVRAMTFGELVDAILDKRWETPPEGFSAGKDRPNKLGCVVMAIPVLMLLAIALLSDCFKHAWLSPVAVSRAYQVTGVIGLANGVFGIIAYAASEKKGAGGFLVGAIGSFLLALILLLCVL